MEYIIIVSSWPTDPHTNQSEIKVQKKNSFATSYPMHLLIQKNNKISYNGWKYFNSDWYPWRTTW